MNAQTILARLLTMARLHQLAQVDTDRVRAIWASGQIMQDDAEYIETLWDRMATART
jgi:hypothetical protein